MSDRSDHPSFRLTTGRASRTLGFSGRFLRPAHRGSSGREAVPPAPRSAVWFGQELAARPGWISLAGRVAEYEERFACAFERPAPSRGGLLAQANYSLGCPPSGTCYYMSDNWTARAGATFTANTLVARDNSSPRRKYSVRLRAHPPRPPSRNISSGQERSAVWHEL